LTGSTVPVIGRNAVIEYSSGSAVVIGYAQGCTVDMTQELIKEFALGSNKATILKGGNQTYKIGVDRLYIDETYANLVLNGTPVDFIFTPTGTTAGYIKITVKNVILTAHNTKIDQKGVVAEKVSGEGNNYIVSNF
jgi:hypothetical protein